MRRLAENAKPGGESDLAPTNNLRRDLTFFFNVLVSCVRSTVELCRAVSFCPVNRFQTYKVDDRFVLCE